MPWWYYDKKELRTTPSSRDGIDYDLECQYRGEGARFIIEAGTEMKLGHQTVATGVVYFHRFYMVHSFNAFPKYLTACCALFLAGKVEETPKKARDIIKMAEKKLPAEEFAKFGEDPKEELLVLERILLQSIKFDLQVENPHTFLLNYMKSLKGVGSEQQKMTAVFEMAFCFINDSLCTTLCLQWEPEVIAIAMLHLAAKMKKFDVSNWSSKSSSRTEWWEKFVNGVTVDLLEDICHQALDYYSEKKPASSASSAPATSTSQKKSAAVKVSDKPSVPSPPPPPPPLEPSMPRPNPIMIPAHPPPEPLTAMPPLTVLPPPLTNPIPNVSTMNSIYIPSSAMVHPPPQLFNVNVPPPALPNMPPMNILPSHDGTAQPFRYLYTHNNRY